MPSTTDRWGRPIFVSELSPEPGSASITATCACGIEFKSDTHKNAAVKLIAHRNSECLVSRRLGQTYKPMNGEKFCCPHHLAGGADTNPCSPIQWDGVTEPII